MLISSWLVLDCANTGPLANKPTAAARAKYKGRRFMSFP